MRKGLPEPVGAAMDQGQLSTAQPKDLRLRSRTFCPFENSVLIYCRPSYTLQLRY